MKTKLIKSLGAIGGIAVIGMTVSIVSSSCGSKEPDVKKIFNVSQDGVFSIDNTKLSNGVEYKTGQMHMKISPPTLYIPKVYNGVNVNKIADNFERPLYPYEQAFNWKTIEVGFEYDSCVTEFGQFAFQQHSYGNGQEDVYVRTDFSNNYGKHKIGKVDDQNVFDCCRMPDTVVTVDEYCFYNTSMGGSSGMGWYPIMSSNLSNIKEHAFDNCYILGIFLPCNKKINVAQDAFANIHGSSIFGKGTRSIYVNAASQMTEADFPGFVGNSGIDYQSYTLQTFTP